MHEMSLATNLLALLQQEMQAHNVTGLLHVRVCYGLLANVVPEALACAFEVLTQGTPLSGATITLLPIPPLLACGACHHEFAPGTQRMAFFCPCPVCGEQLGHKVLQGKELYLDSIEVATP